MTRRLIAAMLFVSLLAIAGSGLLMLVVDRPSFTMRLHPVHKTFGLLFVAAAVGHLVLNGRALWAHLRQPGGRAAAAVAALLLVAAVSASVLQPLPPEAAQQLDDAARALEAH